MKGPEDFVSFNIEFKENQQKAKEELVFQEENLEESTLFDPTKELSRFVFPPTDLLQKPDKSKIDVPKEELLMLGKKIEKTLLDHKIEATVVKATIGPSVTLFELQPAAGVPLAKIQRLGQDLAMSLKAPALSIPIAPIPSKGTIGLEVPNDKRQMVTLRELLESNVFRDTKMDIPLVLGKTISNEVFIADLAKMPHLLIAGATGQGKSVGINTILMSILYKQHPANLKLVLIDPKKVELSIYSPLIKHYLGFLDEEEPIITDTQKVIATLASLCKEMDDRYNLLKDARVRSIKEYNEKFISRVLSPKKGHRFLPYIVLIIDEFADLIMTAGKDVEIPIARLAQLARAIGIHLIIATQRPTTNIITGTIKANFPARIAFTVSSGVDSKTILDSTGAEDLIGKGDMLVGMDGKTVRVQGAFVDTAEVDAVIDFVGKQQGFAQPFYLPEVEEGNGGDGTKVNLSELDPMIRDAAHLIVQNQSGSTSMLQRRFEIGYNRAGRIMDQLEGLKVVGPAKNSKPREVYFDWADELERFLSQYL